jgi:hypothetical protein
VSTSAICVSFIESVAVMAVRLVHSPISSVAKLVLHVLGLRSISKVGGVVVERVSVQMAYNQPWRPGANECLCDQGVRGARDLAAAGSGETDGLVAVIPDG